MPPNRKASGSCLENLVEVMAFVAHLVLIGLILLVVAIVGDALYLTVVWIAPYVERLYDAIVLYFGDTL